MMPAYGNFLMRLQTSYRQRVATSHSWQRLSDLQIGERTPSWHVHHDVEMPQLLDVIEPYILVYFAGT